MAEHTKKIHFIAGGTEKTAQLYTSIADVVPYNVEVNADGTTGGISLYTSIDDVQYPAISMQDGNNTVYAQLVSPQDTRASNLRCTYNGTEYAVAKEKNVDVGICLVQTGGGSGTWQRIDGDGNALSNIDFDSVYPWSDIHDVIVDGQAMVWIPKFYVKIETFLSGPYTGKKYWLVSEHKRSGFHTHPAFMLNGQEIDGYYIGAYEAYNAGSSKAGSASGKTPWTSIGGWENAKTYCSNRGADWHLQSIYEHYAISLLFLIEYGTPDVQTAIGAGNTNSSAAIATGGSNAVYRGMHELWGNVCEHVDGIKCNHWGSEWCDLWDVYGNHTYPDNRTTIMNGNYIVDTYITADCREVFIPSSVAAAENATYPDISTAPTSDWILLVSGCWSYGAGAGLFTFDRGSNSSASNNQIGMRLAKYPS